MAINTQNITVNQLPASLHEVVDIIGLPATLKLVEYWGGLTQLYIPVKINSDHILVQRLGREAAMQLCEVYGGDYLRNIPRCTATVRYIRDQKIREENANGTPAARLALNYCLTERQIWSILAQADKQDERQSNLF